MITLDPSKQVPISMRRATQAIFKIVFKDGAGDPLDISSIAFRLLISKPNDHPKIILANAAGLVIGGDDNNELTITISDTQSDITPFNYLWKLMNDTAKLAWLNGDFTIHTGKSNAVVPADVVVAISDTSDTISVTITSLTDIDGGTP